MKNMYDGTHAQEIRDRLGRLRPDSPRRWGKMTASQMLAHCAAATEMALGDRNVPRLFIGRLIGPLFKRRLIGTETPLRQNAPTAPEFVMANEHDLEVERARLLRLVDRFADGGKSACTTVPHPFFGKLTPDEWAMLVYKHLDHHLRQFSV